MKLIQDASMGILVGQKGGEGVSHTSGGECPKKYHLTCHFITKKYSNKNEL